MATTTATPSALEAKRLRDLQIAELTRENENIEIPALAAISEALLAPAVKAAAKIIRDNLGLLTAHRIQQFSAVLQNIEHAPQVATDEATNLKNQHQQRDQERAAREAAEAAEAEAQASAE